MAAIKERPILFSGAMVRALLAGTKTQTRRAIKLQTGRTFDERALVGAIQEWRPVFDKVAQATVGNRAALIRCPYGVRGNRLWVRETWAYHVHAQAALRDEDGPWVYAADGAAALQMRLCDRWRPSIHMSRVASRMTLEVTGVRVERLQDISAVDAIAEGVEPKLPDPLCSQVCPEDYVAGYRALWGQINGAGSWDANPWVWVVEFRRLA